MTFVRRFATSAKRRTDAPSEHVARIGWTLVTLLLDEAVEYAACRDRFGVSLRVFQRDLKQLRQIGKSHGFWISPIRGGRALLHGSAARVERVGAKSRDAKSLLSRIAAALGEPIAGEVRASIGDEGAVERYGFLHVREALPRDGARVAETFARLKQAAAGPARVEFTYTTARRARSVRRVEPYHVIVRSGRSYLVGYDLDRRDWRHFALDAIAGPIRNIGTFTPRVVPERFLAQCAVGWISGGSPIDVTFALTPLVAASVTSRQWQYGQRTAAFPDGSAEITLSFNDLAEAVRWALGFGEEAVVVAPAEAVVLACRTLDRLARIYERQTAADRQLRTG